MVGLQWKEVLERKDQLFSDHYFLLPPCNLKTDNLNNSFIFTVNLTLLKEILGIPRWSGGGGGVGQGEGGRKR